MRSSWGSVVHSVSSKKKAGQSVVGRHGRKVTINLMKLDLCGYYRNLQSLCKWVAETLRGGVQR